MPTAWETFPVEFKGGLISNLSPLQQGINKVGSASILQNYEPARDGGYSKVLGYVKYSDFPVTGSGVVLGTKIVNNSEVVAARSNGFVTSYYVSTGTDWALLATAEYLGKKLRHDEFNFDGTHKVVFVDGVNYPAIYNDTENSISFITPPVDLLGASSVKLYKNHLFFAKGSELIFSAPYSETDYTPANGSGTIDLGHDITGIVVFRDILFVFARNKIVQISGSSVADFTVAPVTQAIGCINGDTIQEVGGDVMYLAPDGLRLLSATDRNDDFALEIASDPISRDAKLFAASSSNFSSLTVRSKAQYRIFSYNPSDSRAVSRGLLATKFSAQGAADIQWGTLLGFKVACCDSKYTEAGEEIIFANEDGYVYLMEFGNSFDGENILAVYESPYMPITDPQIRKTLYKMTFYVTPTGVFSIRCGIRYDFDRINGAAVIQPPAFNIQSTSGGSSLWGTSIWGSFSYGGSVDKVYISQLVGSGKTFSVRFSDDSTNPSHKLDAAIFEYLPLDRQ